MKKKILIGSTVAAAALVVVVGAYSIMGFAEKEKSGEGKLIANSEYGKVYESDIKDYLTRIELMTGNKVDPSTLQKDELEFVAKDIVIQRKIAKEARKSPVTRQIDVKEKIRVATDGILKGEYLNYIASQNISDDAVRAKYESLKKNLEGKQEYKIKHILVETQDEAKDALKMLYSKSFEDVAKEVSKDPGTAQKGGELGYLVLDSLDKDFADKVKGQAIGKISSPFKTKFGWHIIIVEDKRDAQPATFEAVKDNLKKQMQTQYISDYIKEMFDNTKVELKE
jgi:peptidyl-prolyl cis-trans isomerase C